MEEQGIVLQKITDDGAAVVSTTYGETPQIATCKRRKHLAIAGQLSLFDIQIVKEIRLAGGEYKIDNYSSIHEDDYVEFSIIDKDDVLGLFSTYGLTQGVDILEIFKFVRQEYVDVEAKFYSTVGCAYRVFQGLYFRIAYNSFGTTDIKLKSRILWFE
jgi:hypothetical protein